MKDREDVLKKAVDDCFREMYAKAQPSADFDQLVQDAKDGKIGRDDCVYERYYLSSEEFKYIVDKYVDMYRIRSEWQDDVDVVLDFLENGGTDEVRNDDTGDKEYVRIPGLKDELYNIIGDSDLADKVYGSVIGKINKCKRYYRFNAEESAFRFSTAFGPSPTCNMKTVKDYWKNEKGIDVEIEERNPLTFWERDEYGDEFESVMKDEYGENWKDELDRQWKDEKEKKKWCT